jgi:hypothetical protein
MTKKFDVYIVEEIDYDDIIRHGIFLTEKSAIKKLKTLATQNKKLGAEVEWSDDENGFYIFETRFCITKEEVQE